MKNTTFYLKGISEGWKIEFIAISVLVCGAETMKARVTSQQDRWFWWNEIPTYPTVEW